MLLTHSSKSLEPLGFEGPQGVVLDDLDPVFIRIQYKSDMPHPSVRQSLLPVHTRLLKMVTRCL